MKKTHPGRLGTSNDIIIYHPDSKFYFIPITKNASSFTYRCLSQIDWQYYKLYHYGQLEDKIPVVILRDPVERWLSGFAQDYIDGKFPLGLNHPETLNNIFLKGVSGIHTYTQHWYVKNYKLYNAVFIKFTKGYIDLPKIFKYNIENIDDIDEKSKGYSFNKDSRIQTLISNHYETNPVYQQNLHNYLKDDFELYNNANFIAPDESLSNYKSWDSYNGKEDS